MRVALSAALEYSDFVGALTDSCSGRYSTPERGEKRGKQASELIPVSRALTPPACVRDVAVPARSRTEGITAV